jgi:hypothetical protein
MEYLLRLAQDDFKFMNTPNGIDEIVSTFGNIHTYISDDGTLLPEWEEQFMSIVTLPFSIPLAWSPATIVTRMTCHKLMVQIFEDVFAQIVDAKLQAEVTSFGGCFSYRPQRTGSNLSTHAWGIAIDLNPATNEQGTNGTMDQGIITIFREAGFKWGGDWVGRFKDPMHFQFATGY